MNSTSLETWASSDTNPRSNNLLGGYDNEFFHYSFTGQVLKKCYVHKTSYIASELTENYRFTYDKADRITGEYHQLNTQPEIALATMTYDDLGRMTRKILHGGGEAIDYTYNIRNWTKSITSPRFSETMYYQDALDGKPVCYNGNISAVKWGQGSTQEQKYYYTYDGLNRMKKATYWPDETYNEEITQYDKNGNILGLNRNGYVRGWDNEFPVFTGPIDEISFEYNGNQMRNAWDNLDDQDILNTTTNDFRDIYVEGVNEKYLYDANGNQYADLNKGIAWIQYNSLNLPSKMQFSNGNKNEYLYDASGVKHKATYSYAVNPMQIPLGQTTIENNGTNLTQSSYTDYCGNYVYEDGKIKRILTPEGYIEAAGIIPMNYIGYWTYNYLLKDHLGNTRMCLSSNYISAKSTILNNYGGSTSTIDYYPFGMEMERIGIHYGPLYAYGYLPGTVTPYLYNGKEMDRMNGLNEYDYGARWRDPTLGNGWNTVDPLAEKYYSISPYAYCNNNPVRFNDPDGRAGGDPNSGGTAAVDDDNKKTTAQSSTAINTPKKFGIIKRKPVTPLQAAAKVAKSKPRGEIKPAGGTAQEKYVKAYNELPEIEQQAVTNPVINAIAVGGLAVMGVVAVPEVASTVEEVATSPTTIKTAIDIYNVGSKAAPLLPVTEGVLKGILNAPPDTPYLINNGNYITAVDFFNSLTTIYKDNVNTK